MALENEPHLVKMYRASIGCAKVFVPRRIPRNEYDTFACHRKGYDINNDRCLVCLEHCKYGDLFDVIRHWGAITDDRLLRYIMLQICNGVDSLHTKAQLAHLDLKIENVLIGDD